MNVSQKDVVLLPYPFSNLQEKKVRPAIVVSNDNFNRTCSDCIAVPLTSALKESPFSVSITQKDMKNGKLIKSSEIRIDKIFSVEKRLIQMKIGNVNDFFFDKLKNELLEIF